ncbi:hypothetical protein Cs308_0989 [Candidatus Chlamydia sanziniae]|uniref:Uncharacterized protein n=1 Tax=Candidatus Chlamydia sanziniae TaxID=1806891 RepID=A0A1A9HVY5_9CHLA|nr:hypothetical protein Cs308_0989 [Candidatus Chlamydia sanziniae]
MLEKFIVFFLRLLFPYLCYGCGSPGALFCSCCLEKLSLESKAGRCLHCFRYLNCNEINVCCHCLPTSCIHTLSLYKPTKVALSIYFRACDGKLPALQFFIRSIQQCWETWTCPPTCVIYIISKIPKEFIVSVAKSKNIPYYALWPGINKEKQIRKLPLTGPKCFLSTYPLTNSWYKAIEKSVAQPTLILSLFLSDLQ